jgi:HEAT repeat protein
VKKDRADRDASDADILRIRELRRNGDAAALLEELGEAEPRSVVQSGAIEALGKVGDKRAVGPIVALLERDEVDRALAMAILARLESRDSEGALQAGLDEADPLVRAKAAEGLGAIKTRSAVPRLTEMLESEIWWERLAAARALARIADPDSAGDLKRVRARERRPWRRRLFPRGLEPGRER